MAIYLRAFLLYLYLRAFHCAGTHPSTRYSPVINSAVAIDDRLNCPRKQVNQPITRCYLAAFRDAARHGDQGSFQSTGSAPCCSRSRLARLNGCEPKNPLLAEYGLGCADSMQPMSPSSGTSVRASRPHKIATSGASRAARARMACSVTSSQPLPRCEPGLPGWTVSTRLSSSTPRSLHGVRSPFAGAG